MIVALFWALIAAQFLAAQQHTWTGVDRIVAVGDVHGDFDQFLQVLRDAEVVDPDGEDWIGGKTHLVQTGDIPDRGPDTRRILDFLMDLEKQARQNGGYVHCLIGNHEAMNIYGDLRYVTPEEFAAFRTGRSERIRDAYYRQEVERMKRNPPPEGLPLFDRAHRASWNVEHPLGYVEHRFAYGPKGDYGPWITEHNTVIKVNDTLFVHGGISPRIAQMSLERINETVRAELTDFSRLKEGIVIADDGPLWYRGLAKGNEEALAGHVDQMLAKYGAKRIVVGHTPTVGAVIPRFDARVLRNDVGLAEHYGGNRACVVIEDGIAYAIHRGERLEIPDEDDAAYVRYLRRAAELDPDPSPLLPLIEQAEESVGAAFQ